MGDVVTRPTFAYEMHALFQEKDWGGPLRVEERLSTSFQIKKITGHSILKHTKTRKWSMAR